MTAAGMAAPLVLASSSPRRLALLRQVGIEPAMVMAPEIDETPLRDELPRAHARRLARAKAEATALRLDRPAFVLAADTVVACGRRILPKALDAATARACLELLSGRRHRVHGGLCVLAPDGRLRQRDVLTMVQIKRLTEAEIGRYLASEEWRDKAGGYAIQGLAARFVTAVSGSYPNVVGLPLAETVAILEGLGWREAEAAT